MHASFTIFCLKICNPCSKVLTEKIIVDEKGPEKTVQVESTIPIPCNTAHVDECKISFSVDTHTKGSQVTSEYSNQYRIAL